MTHIKYPNGLGLPVSIKPNWQVEAMHQNALLHDALTRAEIAEAKLAKAVEESHRWKMECEDFWRKREDAAEDKLAKAYDIIARIIAIAPDGDEYDDEWHITYDAAKELLNKMEAGE